jgi:hypothetical protein
MTQKKTKQQLEDEKEYVRLLEQIFGGKIKLRPQKPMRPRPITSQERAWLIRGLNSLRTGEYVGCHAIDLDTWRHPPLGPPVDPQPYLDQLDKLVVIQKCNCGGKPCHTVYFQESQWSEMRTLVMHCTDDGRWLNICVNHTTQELVKLEIIGGGEW